jgi:hypothetical protein
MMASDIEQRRLDSELALPWDLGQWLDPCQLSHWIAEEVEALDWASEELTHYLETHPAYHPKILLNLLTFAYATATFESDEILRRCFADSNYQTICNGHVPVSTSVIRRFRRENRGLLKWSLLQVFKRVVRKVTGHSWLPAGIKRTLLGAAITRLDLARQLDYGAETM